MIPKAVLRAALLMFCWLSSVAQDQALPWFGFGPEALAQQKSATARPANAAREDERYNAGAEYLDDGKWSEAVAAFSEVAGLKGQRADAALYWKAYALNKMGRRNDALAAIAELRRGYPRSNWLKEASALEVEMRSASGKQVNPESESDEELKILAINSLMNSDEARAIPMLQRVLESPSNSPRLKEKALFVLAQSDSQQAQQLIGSVARGQSYPPLQLKAIQYLGISGGQNRQTLEQIYRSSTDANVKRAVLQAFITCDCEQSTLAVVREERDPELRRRAIHNLGAMGATEQLRQLFQSSTSAEDKEKIMEALGIAGDTTILAEIARAPGDVRVRRRAIHGLGISGGKQAGETLMAIYTQDRDSEVRKAAVEALFIQGADHELVQLARKETDPQMRRYLVEKLSLMGSKEADDYMLELLNK